MRGNKTTGLPFRCAKGHVIRSVLDLRPLHYGLGCRFCRNEAIYDEKRTRREKQEQQEVRDGE